MPDNPSSTTTINISFEGKEDRAPLAQVHVANAKEDLSKSPDKIKQLADLLGLPQGTTAVVRVTVLSSITR